jgi:hypothetical protein
MEDKETLLNKLLQFYIKFKELPTYAALTCPFNGSKLSCLDLCYKFDEISASTDRTRCPCHVWGHYKSFKQLKKLLINYDMIESSDIGEGG